MRRQIAANAAPQVADNCPETGRAYASDPAAYERLVRPWELCNTPLARGEFGYTVQYLRTPGVTIYRETFRKRCRLRGLSPADTLAVCVPLVTGPKSSYWGSAPSTSAMVATLPGGMDAVLDRHHTQLLVLLARSYARSRMPEVTWQALEQAAAGHRLPGRPADVGAFARWASALLDGAARNPALMSESDAAGWIADEVLQRLLTATRLPERETPRPARSLRHKALAKALELLRKTGWSGRTIAEISAAVGVSQRTLEYAFQDAFGLTPLGFIRLRRLHAARRALMEADPADTTVTRVALAHGFQNPGRFARYFRDSFGEHPSAVLDRAFSGGNIELSPLPG